MADCRCSNITIMQLFHQLKQRFPTVPDHVVSKVIQQNCHDKSACETILQKESHNYVQCYPGALISGEGRPTGPLGPLSDRCSLGPGPPRRSISSTDSDNSATPAVQFTRQYSEPSTPSSKSDETEPENTPPPAQTPSTPDVPPRRARPPTLEEKIKLSKIPLGQLIHEAQERQNERVSHKIPDSLPCENKEDGSTSPEGEPAVNEKTVTEPSSQPEESPKSSKEQPETVANQRARSPQSSKKSPTPAVRTPVRPTTLSYDTSKLPRNSSGVSPNRLHPPPISPNHRSSTSSCSPGSSKSSPGHVPNSRPLPRRGASPNTLAPPHANIYFGCASPESPKHDAFHSSQDSPQEYKVAVECVVGPSRPGDKPGAFTSVNLTLRPPSAENPKPIEFSSGQSVTYTTAKIDPRQGYQSHLQIRISPTLLQKQRDKKDLLARELVKQKDKLNNMRIKVRALQTALSRFKPSPLIVNKLKADRDRLRAECERLTAAVDQYLDQPSDNFYSNNLYTGQQRGGWSCRLCTFQNHPLMTSCEQCEMPRLELGTATNHPEPVSNPLRSNNNSFFVAGETSGSVSRTIAPLQER